jgi:small-conductance mechanosensitive channel/CRP-like cAMP-binding protein
MQSAAGMSGRYHWVLLGLIVSTFLLGAIAPTARPRLRATLVFLTGSFVAMLVCAWMLHTGTTDESTSTYRYLHFVSQLLLAIGGINLASVLLFRVLLAPAGMQPPPILRDTLLGISYVIVALTLLSRHGVDLTGIVATSAVVTAVIGFSLQDTLGNVMGGVALQMERSICVGDWVRLGDTEGVVREIRWRQTSIETRNWDTVVIPNSVLMKSQVTVLGRRMGKPLLHRMWVEFAVDYRFSPVDVIDAVERALQAEPIADVASDPVPNCILKEFKESYGQYAVRYWLKDFAKDSPTSSEVRTRIFVALQRAGMGLSIPAQTVYLKMQNRQRKQQKQEEERGRRAAALKGVAVFQPLTDAERLELADGLSVAPFRRGEVITRQGNEAHFLYIIIKGDAEVRVATTDGAGRVVAALSAGQVFGEMGLLTGARRSATVTALTDTLCYRLDKEGFKDVLQRRPEIAEAISHLLAKRKVEIDALTQGIDAEAAHQRAPAAQHDLLQNIRRFFMLD